MKSGYDQYFKQVRKASQGGESTLKPNAHFKINQKKSSQFGIQGSDIEEALRSRVGVRKKKTKKIKTPWALILFSTFGILLTGLGMLNAELIESYIKRIEFSMYTFASAEPPKSPAVAKQESTPVVESARSVSSTASADLGHLSKLVERQKELDARAEELTRQESEIGKMKLELEKRLAELESMRTQISEILAERVKVDAERVETLVQMYSNMKPQQAAEVFKSLDEDLAVELLSRMKKKNAADIMNLLPAEKAQIFSERYAGYKRK